MQPSPQPGAPNPALHTSDGRAAATNTAQFITFTLDAEEYGVDIMAVREIKGWSDTTTIPNAPPYVRGVINLRGVIVPIFDLRARFGMGTTQPTPMHVVIIVIAGTRTMGLLVDAVSDIIAVEPGMVRPVPEMGLPADDRYLDGLVALDKRMVTLVSLDRLFALDAERPRALDPAAKIAAQGSATEAA